MLSVWGCWSAIGKLECRSNVKLKAKSLEHLEIKGQNEKGVEKIKKQNFIASTERKLNGL